MIIHYKSQNHALMTASLTESRAWGSQASIETCIQLVNVITAQQDNTEIATKSQTAPCLHRIHQVCSSWCGIRTERLRYPSHMCRGLINASQTATDKFTALEQWTKDL